MFLYKYLAKAARLPHVLPGDRVEIEVDLALAHDGTGPKLLQAWAQQTDKMYDGRRLLLTVDHAFPAPTPQERSFQRQFSQFAKAQGCVLYNHGEGVLHQIVAERASLWPGMIIVGADGHVATSGAYGALAFALTPEELVPVLVTGKLALKVPELLTIELTGELPSGTLARDVAFYLMWKLGPAMKGKAVALTGAFVQELSPSGRMTLCNILPEAGAFTAFIVPKDEEAGPISHWIDVDTLEPMVAVPHQPTNVRPVREMEGTEINVAIAGGCSAGRLEDMEIIAGVLQEKPVHSDVTFIITPASQTVAKEMDKRGISALLREKGAVIMPPGCGPCPGKHFGVLASGDRAITTTVRNTSGRIGANDAEIYLASPLTVARAAVNGII
ncbi:MAG: aconitase family protein [Desulfitobacteriaceae bacterium]